jgi:hypothetical protein
MNRWMIRRLIQSDYENLLDSLSSRQHLQPHEPISASLAMVVDQLGVCPGAVEQAVRWLGVDPATSIGRLRRTELTQLARSIHRFWRQRTGEPEPSQPSNRSH